MNDDRRSIFTIGHGDHDFASVAALLRGNGVGVIADVRSVPYSRHAPEFTKDELTRRTAEFNLAYRWLGDRLGGRSDDPALLRNGEPDWERIAASDRFAAGMTELEGLAASSTIALLCSELDPTHCHRATLIAPALESRGYEVHHILDNGDTIRHQPTLDLD